MLLGGVLSSEQAPLFGKFLFLLVHSEVAFQSRGGIGGALPLCSCEVACYLSRAPWRIVFSSTSFFVALQGNLVFSLSSDLFLLFDYLWS